MPNWCENHITISNPKVFKEKCMKNGNFSFNNIIPQPKHMRVYNELNMSESEEELFESLGINKENLSKELNNNFFCDGAIDFLYAKGWMDKEAERTGIKTSDWYQWNCDNWGTKWDLSTDDLDSLDLDGLCEAIKNNDSFRLQFDTAWAPPIPVLQKMAELGVVFDWECEEGGCGIYMEGQSDGESFSCWDCDPPKEDEDEE